MTSISEVFELEANDIIVNTADSKSCRFTFFDKRMMLPNYYSNAGIDLLYISVFVYAADRLILRELAEDSWSRTIDLYIPVLDVEQCQKNVALMEELLAFLSGDIWCFHFRQRELTTDEMRARVRFEENQKAGGNNNYSVISMLSGGLDSFIGAIDLLESGERPLFVSHYGGGKGTVEYQSFLSTVLSQKYGIGPNVFASFHAAVVNGKEDTTRTRSFMYFAHAVILGTAMNGIVTLIIPENGLISLNIPLTESRIGTSSTRTTHPHYLELLQKLLDNFGIRVVMQNPYQFFTKGEMIVNCLNQEFLKTNIKNTMSCSHPDQGRMEGRSKPCHCGVCLPCVIRRAAVKHADIIDESEYRDPKMKNGKTAQINRKSYLLGLEKYNPQYAFLSIQRSGPIKNKILEYEDLYKRGMEELRIFMEAINE